MSQHTLRRGSRRYAVGESAAYGLDPLVITWANQVVTNGGAIPSFATQISLSLFVQNLANAGLMSAMYIVNCLVPDSLTAMLTPLIVGPGPVLWTGHSLVSGDLTTGGIKGDASSKYIDTGVNPSTMFFATVNIGLSLYTLDIPGTAANNWVDCGVINTGNSANNFVMLPAITSVASWETGGTSTGNVTTAINLNGFYSGSRVSAADSRLYFANSTNALTQYGATAAGASNAPLNGSIFLLAGNDLNGGSAPNLFSSRHSSFLAFHRGLTLAQTTAFFTAVQTLRANLGGGFA